MLFSVPFGDEVLPLEVSDRQVVLNTEPSFPQPIGGPDQVAAAVWEALSKPIDSPSLSELVQPGSKVLLLVDNFARATPAYLILPGVLQFLKARGAQVEIIIASGVLWQMSEEQLEAKLGRDVTESGIPILQNDARNPEDYEFVGITTLGTPIWAHKAFVEADVRLGIGLTQANLWGYGGGGKIFLPGVCSYETIEWNHRLSTAPGSSFGVLPEYNPIRQDIEEAAEIAGLTMTLNVILDAKRRVLDIKAGKPRSVHSASVARYREIYSYEVAEPAAISVAGGFPWDTLFAHSCWGAVGLDRATRDGGTMILATPCQAGIGHVKPIRKYMPATRQSLAEAFKDFFHHRAEFWDGVIWYKLLEVLTRKQLLVVSLEKNLEGFREIGLWATTSIDEAFEKATADQGDDSTVAFVPWAKWCVPR